MKKNIATFLIILLSMPSFGQNNENTARADTACLIAIVKKNTYLKDSPSYYSSTNYDKDITDGDAIFLYQIHESKKPYGSDSELYYACYYDRDSGYIRANDVFISKDDKDYLENATAENYIKRRDDAKTMALLHYYEKLKQFIALYETYDKKGFVITNKEYAYSDYQFGLKLTFYNGYSKDIKYIDFTVRPYNRVGDIVFDDLRRNKFSGQIIGPLKKKTESSVTFDEMFWDDKDIIECIKITYLKITFMDGTIKVISNIAGQLGKEVYNDCK